jgi:crotonobetainyl-CoA:carnitine CoA-transferase CaiB-like acyl-CoA transferase
MSQSTGGELTSFSQTAASAGNVKGIKSAAIHLSETVLDTYAAPPKLGEHTNEVLIGLLGYSSDKVNALRREGVV